MKRFQFALLFLPIVAVACAVALTEDASSAPSAREQLTYEDPEFQLHQATSEIVVEVEYSDNTVRVPVTSPAGSLALIAAEEGGLALRSVDLDLGTISAGDKGLLPLGFHMRNARLTSEETHWCSHFEWAGDESCEATVAAELRFEAELQVSDGVWLPMSIPAAVDANVFVYSQGENLRTEISASGVSAIGSTYPVAISKIDLRLVASESGESLAENH
jgi:hypothetical protein